MGDSLFFKKKGVSIPNRHPKSCTRAFWVKKSATYITVKIYLLKILTPLNIFIM